MLKHGILRRYLEVFATKASTNSEGRRVAFIDGYAGPGTYRDGTPGSPAIALESAERVASFRLPRDLRCLFVEEHEGLAEELGVLVGEYEGDHQVYCSRIEDCLDDLVAQVQQMPLLAFLDPFGLGMPLERIVEAFLDRPNVVGRATEVILNFNLTGLPRFGGLLTSTKHNPARDAQLAAVDAVMGGPEWRDIWDPKDTEASSDAVAQLFCKQADKLSNRGWGYYRTGVGDKWDGRADYELILLTSHADGMWLFNQALSGAMEDFYAFCHPDQQTTDAPKLRKQELVDAIAANVRTLLKEKGGLTIKNNVAAVYGDTLGFARETHVRAAIKQLYKEGLTSHDGKGDVKEFYIAPAETT